MLSDIRLEKITLDSAADLAGLLARDKRLAASLRVKRPPKTAQEFFDHVTQWQKDTKSDSFAIGLRDKYIGLISLSHQNGQSARVGYWLGSEYWHKGYTTNAFHQIIELAKRRGFKNLGASMEPGNIASIRIWEKAGAKLVAKDNKILAELELV